MLAGIGAGVTLGSIFVVTGFITLPVQTDAYTILLVVRRETILLWLSNYVHIIVSWLQIILGLFLILGVAARLTTLASSVLIVLFVCNNIWLLREGVDPRSCHCLGDAVTRFLANFSPREALYIDFSMLGLILLILAFSPDKWLSLRPWFLKNRPHGESAPRKSQRSKSQEGSV
jgi:uncharacterized membrane protein YphA (DoxX/SURF4 family)